MTVRTENPVADEALTDKDFAGFLAAHASFRCEYGRLAGVAGTATEPGHVALIEEQIVLATTVLHHHHTSEDVGLWPLLRMRAPEWSAALDELEQEHGVVDPLIGQVRDVSVPLAERAAALAQLHRALNEHLDHEEAVALPLIRSCMSRSEWAEGGRRVIEETPREVLPLMLGLCASALAPGDRAAAFGEMPPPVRDLFERMWWPAYERRFAQLYGSSEAGARAA